jgi:hypothetical protein
MMTGDDFCFQFESMTGEGFNARVTKVNCQLKLSVMLSGATFDIIIHTKEQEGCATACPLGQRHMSATDCACVDVETLPAVGTLYQAHDYAIDT